MNKKPLLIATLGYPGSGKTYFSERLAKNLNLFHINADKIRHEMFDIPVYTPEEHRAVFRFINWLTQELLQKGMSVILDANSNKEMHRARFATFAQNAKAQYVLVYMKTPIEVAEKRLIERRSIKGVERKKYYPSIEVSVLHKMKNEIEYPKSGEHVVEIDGLESYPLQFKTFNTWLTNKKHG